MDCCARFRAAPLSSPSALVVRAEGRRRLRCESACGNIGSCATLRLAFDSQGLSKFCENYRCASQRTPRGITLASAKSNECDSGSVIMPLEPVTPEGRFLCGILKNQPHIFPVAAARQLEELANDRNSAIVRWAHSMGSEESYLHRKIAEMKDRECQIAVEEVMYMLIVDKFSAIKVPMVPNLSKSIKYARLDMSLSKDAELESIYDSEVVEMVREHLFNILEWKGKINLMGKLSMMHIKWVQLERIYAASIMYGYFIKSVSLRHQLELSLARTDEDPHQGQLMNSELVKTEQEEKLVALGCSFDMASSLHHNYDRKRVEKLKSYMMGFDTETLQICAQLRSQAAVNLIEKQSCALFEDCLKSTQKNDGNIIVTYSAFKRLVLEAVAFGSFLWDVERYVDSIYILKAA